MIWFKRALALVALSVVLYLFWPLIGELRNAASLFLHAQWGWLIVAVLIQLLSYACLTELNYLLLQPFKGKINHWRLMAILPTMAFIEVAIPSAGASGVVLRARFLGRGGYTPEVSTFTLILETLYLGAAMLAVSFSGFWYLLHTGELSSRQTILLAVVACVSLAIAAMAIWAGWKRERAREAVLAFSSLWNHLASKFYLKLSSPDKVVARVDNFYDGLAQLGRRSRIPYLVFAFSRVALDVTSLGVCFIAFSYSIMPGILLTGYGIMLALSGLGALPGGLGLADASLAVIFARLGAPGAVAVAAALAYRLIAFWLIRFIGFINWQVLEARS
jgi:uncharacterized protein (TIRG00374 family)